MAAYYFDNTSPIGTAGFGTLNGSWTDSKWSDSSAGTATTGIAWPGAGHEATFGGLTNTAVGGTLTASGVINLDAITVQRLTTTTTQVLSGGTLNFGSVPAQITVGSSLRLTVNSDLSGTAGFTKAGTGDLFIGGSTKALDTSVADSAVTVDAGNLWINAGLGTGTPNQLANVTKLVVNATLIYSGNLDYTEDAAISGSGLIQANLNGFTMTYSGDISDYSGYITNYEDTTGLTNPVIFSTPQSFPAAAATYSDIAGKSYSNTFTWTYTGAASVTQTGGNYSLFRNLNGTSTMASEYINSSLNNSPITYQGNFGAYPNSTFSGGTHNIRFNAALGDIVVSGNILSGFVTTRTVAKLGPQKLTLSGANTYTGLTTISGGTLSAQGIAGTRTPLGAGGASGGAVTTSSTGVLDISSTPYDPVTAPNGTDAANPMVVDKTTRTLTLGSSGNPQITSTTGFNRLDCGTVTLNTDLLVSVEAGAYLKVNNTAAMTGVSRSATKTGAGEFDFGSFANTFSSTTGTVTVSAGTVSFGASVLSGTASPLGQSSTAIALAGTLKYNGAGGHSLTRAVALSGSPSFDASGAGAVTFSPAITHAAGARTITFTGTSTNDNTFTTALADNGASVVALTKTGAAKWILSAQPTYTGLTTVSEGELQFSGLNLGTDLTVNGTGKLSNTVINGSSKTITCDGGTPEIASTNANNTVTGTTAVTSGTLRLTSEAAISGKPAKVLGDTVVTVSSGAAIRTTTGIVQRGRMVYGGDLTFSGGTLYIGG